MDEVAESGHVEQGEPEAEEEPAEKGAEQDED